MNYAARFDAIKTKCIQGRKEDIDFVLGQLHPDVELPVTVNKAYDMGLVDRLQAYSR